MQILQGYIQFNRSISAWLFFLLLILRLADAQEVQVSEEFTPESDVVKQLETQAQASPGQGSLQSFQTWRQLGFDEVQKRHAENAIEAFTYALEYRPDDKQSLFGLGTAYVQLQQYGEALTILKPLVEKFPDDFSLINNLAWIYATADDIQYRDAERAIELARKALLMQPEAYHVWHTLAVAYYLKGDYERAMRIAEEAVDLAQVDKSIQWFELHDLKTLVDTCRKALQAKDLMK